MEATTPHNATDEDMSTAEWLDWKIDQGRYGFASHADRLEFEAEVAAQDRGDTEIPLSTGDDEADRLYNEIWQQERSKRGLAAPADELAALRDLTGPWGH